MPHPGLAAVARMVDATREPNGLPGRLAGRP